MWTYARRALVAVGVVVAVLLGSGASDPVSAAQAQGGKFYFPIVYQPPARSGSYEVVAPQSAWTGLFWPWLVGNPFATEQTGPVDCTVNQSGDVWFLAGTSGDLSVGAVQRSCTVPAGKTVVAPLFTIVFYNGAGENYTVAEKRKELDDIFSDKVSGAINSEACFNAASINGTKVDPVRVQSPSFALIDPNVFGGVNDPAAVQDGYWIAFKPQPGKYEVKFTGGLCELGTGPSGTKIMLVDVKYDITVQ